MKKLYFLLFTFLIAATSFGQEAVITGYVDSPCPNADGRTVEIYVDGTVDFTGWKLVRQSNGGGYTYNIDISSFGILTDEFAYITNNATILNSEFGISTNVISNSGVNDNGDDAFQLVNGSTVIDRFGEDLVDGTGKAWEHEDTYYYRVNGTPANGGSFSSAQFTYGALQFLDGKGLCNSDSALSTYVPFGSYSSTGSTAPTLFLVGLPASGGSIEVGPEDLAGELEFATQNFTVGLDGYISWEIKNQTDGGTIHDTGFIYDLSSPTPFATLLPNKEYFLLSVLYDNTDQPLLNPEAYYQLTANTHGYTDVSSIAELRAVTDNGYYRLTNEAFLTFQQTFRGQKFIQDATGGILIDDNNGVISTTYAVNDGITNIRGQVSEFAGMKQLVPSADYGTPTSSSNVITPQAVTLADLTSNAEQYESELVEVTAVTLDNSINTTFVNGAEYVMSQSTDNFNFRATFFGVDYITANVPTVATDIVGIVNERSGNLYFLTARNANDFSVDVLSNDTFKENTFKIYPNPSSYGYVNISSKSQTAMNVGVYDILGKQVINQTVNNNRLDVSNLTTGIYIMKISQDGATTTKKLIIN